MADEPRLKKEYKEKIRGELLKELGVSNMMEVPVLKKIVVNVGLGEVTSDKNVVEEFAKDLTLITGQKPIPTIAKKAISGFKIREGDEIGLKVTLRGNRMWDFFDKLVNVVMPRTKDFRGLSNKAFDGSGNYTVGVKEHTVFPEIDPNAVMKMRGLEITLVMSTRNDEHAKAFLDKFGFPFSKDA